MFRALCRALSDVFVVVFGVGRVVYCSATGASEPRNLGYMTRLGLWGAAGSPFPGGFKDFLTAVEGRGVGAMELVAMHLKQTGSFVCRTLSFTGCSFEVCVRAWGAVCLLAKPPL